MSARSDTVRVVRKVMGTAVTMGFRERIDETAVNEAFAWLDWVETAFSTFIPDSEISRISSGNLAESDASNRVREVLSMCSALRIRTEGWFEFEPYKAGRRRLDPAGYVKGWSIAQAARILEHAGIEEFFISGGGDVTVGSAGEPWRVGIQHPTDPAATAAVVVLSSGAIATSGLYQRGPHIWGRSREGAAPGLLSTSIVGPDLGIADALASALFACGDANAGWMTRFPAYEVLIATADGRVRTTPGLDGKLEWANPGDGGRRHMIRELAGGEHRPPTRTLPYQALSGPAERRPPAGP